MSEFEKKNLERFGEFLNFLKFSKIIKNSLVFSHVFLNFLYFSRMLCKNVEKILENPRKL